MNRRQQSGFTLIELMIVLVVLAVLVSIAVPSYRNYVIRANRSEAKSALLALATAQEKYYLQCNVYTATLDPTVANTCPATGVTASLRYPGTSERGLYTITVTAADANGWTATAVPSSGTQSRDTNCQFFSLTSAGVRQGSPNSNGSGVTAATTAECWDK